MKKLILVALLSACALPAGAFAQGLKVGTIDMNRAFKEYSKTKDAETKINDAKNSAKKEYDDRADSYKKALDEINKLNQQLEAPALSADAKTQKAKERDEKIASIKNMEREINEFRQTREKQLQEQAVRMRDGIVKEISDVVMTKVKAANMDLVLDSSGVSLNGVTDGYVRPARHGFHERSGDGSSTRMCRRGRPSAEGCRQCRLRKPLPARRSPDETLNFNQENARHPACVFLSTAPSARRGPGSPPASKASRFAERSVYQLQLGRRERNFDRWDLGRTIAILLGTSVLQLTAAGAVSRLGENRHHSAARQFPQPPAARCDLRFWLERSGRGQG